MKQLKAEFLKIRHTFLIPIHIFVPGIAAVLFLLWTRASARLQFLVYAEAIGIVFPVLASVICAGEILKSTAFIENYLESMHQVLRGKKEMESCEKVEVQDLIEMFKKLAEQLSTAGKIPAGFTIAEFAGAETEIICRKEEMLRAWGNLLSNALEHTNRTKGVHVTLEENGAYFVASVRDYGTGFSKKALIHGAEPFFSGDESRHDRNHQGLGLSIAAEFMNRQGGFLKYENAENEDGAVVSLWIKMEEM